MKKFVILRDLNEGAGYSGHRGGVLPRDFGNESAAPGAPAPAEDLPAPGVQITPLSPKDIVDAERDPKVKAFGEVMPTILLAPFDEPAGAAAGAQEDNWGIAATGADAGKFDGRGVRVAVLDTGIDTRHPAFQGVTFTCRDFTTSTIGTPLPTPPENWDVDGHGTHCAGTFFGRKVGNARIGVAPGITEALIGKAIDDRGRGDTEMLFQALQWAINEKVDVVSMSIGFDFPGLIERDIAAGVKPRQAAADALVTYSQNLRLFDALMTMVRARAAFNEGTVIVAACGNESNRDQHIRVATALPAAAEGIVSVGAVGRKGEAQEVAFFSNTDPMICAPGVAIPSAKPLGGIAVKSGTSMACPHVAGIAALWWQALRADRAAPASAAKVVEKMKANARSTGLFAAYSEADYGRGLATAPR